MTTTLDAYVDHYGLGFDRLVRAMTAVGDVWELLGREQQNDLLDFLLPGLGARQANCWDELADPLQRLTHLDAITAVDVLREQGARGPLNPVDAYDRVRAHLEQEIADTIRGYRRTAAAARVAVTA